MKKSHYVRAATAAALASGLFAGCSTAEATPNRWQRSVAREHQDSRKAKLERILCDSEGMQMWLNNQNVIEGECKGFSTDRSLYGVYAAGESEGAWRAFVNDLSRACSGFRVIGGAGLAVVTETGQDFNKIASQLYDELGLEILC